MSAAISKFTVHVIALFATMLVGVAMAKAQDQGGTRARGSFGVPLQPFSAREIADDSPRGEPVRVAYYVPHVPRAQPLPMLRAEPVEEENGREETNSFPEISSNRPMVAGNRAMLRDGIAYAPSNAPANIKNAIWAVNTLTSETYVWGGGHGSFNDYGYDCSGAVSFALHYAGLLEMPLPSSDFRRYGERGHGRWITIYSRNGHTFAVIAGLRLDTTDTRYGGDVGPRWYAEGRDARGFEARHPMGW